MLTLAEANQLLVTHLGTSARAQHSSFVGHLMGQIATALAADTTLWAITGICHDLDFAVTADRRDRHGLVTADWLDGRLPLEALEAIKAHDHRTGVTADTALAAALKLADACAILVETMGRAPIAMLRLESPWPAFDAALTDRPYLTAMLRANCARLGLEPAVLASLLETTPSPWHGQI